MTALLLGILICIVLIAHGAGLEIWIVMVILILVALKTFDPGYKRPRWPK